VLRTHQWHQLSLAKLIQVSSSRAPWNRLRRMVQGASSPRLSSAIRSFWRGLAVFVLFVQIAAAAIPCADASPCGHGAQHASANVLDRHHGIGSELCASAFVPANQVPAIDPTLLVPDLGPAIAVAALWPSAPAVQVAQARQVVQPFAPLPRFLTFGRLLR